MERQERSKEVHPVPAANCIWNLVTSGHLTDIVMVLPGAHPARFTTVRRRSSLAHSSSLIAVVFSIPFLTMQERRLKDCFGSIRASDIET